MAREALQLINSVTGHIVVEQLEIADSFWTRLWGLQFRRSLRPRAGLLLTPCSSVHTAFVRFPIDVVMLDGSNRVLAVRANVRPWRAVIGVKGTHAILELPAGTAQVEVGQMLTVRTQ